MVRRRVELFVLLGPYHSTMREEHDIVSNRVNIPVLLQVVVVLLVSVVATLYSIIQSIHVHERWTTSLHNHVNIIDGYTDIRKTTTLNSFSK